MCKECTEWYDPTEPTFTTTQVNDLLEGLAKEVEEMPHHTIYGYDKAYPVVKAGDCADIIRRAMK